MTLIEREQMRVKRILKKMRHGRYGTSRKIKQGIEQEREEAVKGTGKRARGKGMRKKERGRKEQGGAR